MTTTMKNLEERLAALEALVERVPAIKAIRADEARTRGTNETQECVRKFKSATTDERLTMFKALGDTMKRREIVQQVGRDNWVETLRAISPADRRVFLEGMAVATGGSHLTRWCAFMLGPVPDVVEVRYTGSSYGPTATIAGIEFFKSGQRMFRFEWDELLHGVKWRTGSLLAAIEAADLAVTAVEGDDARRFAASRTDASPPDITREPKKAKAAA